MLSELKQHPFQPGSGSLTVSSLVSTKGISSSRVRLDTHEIDEATLRNGPHEPHAHSVTDVEKPSSLQARCRPRGVMRGMVAEAPVCRQADHEASAATQHVE